MRSRFTLLVLLLLPALASAQIKLSVDATEVSRRILHARVVIPAKPGPMTLVYPKWIPGEHGPTGPITDVAGMKFTAGGAVIPWQRDPVDMYAIHLQVPAGATEVQAQFDCLGNNEKAGFFLSPSTSTELTTINWNQVLLYVEGQATDTVTFTASLSLPAGWKFGTALPMKTQTPHSIEFETVNLTTLVDSPVVAGAHFREIKLTPAGESRPHFMEIAADSDAALSIPEDWLAAYSHLVEQTGSLFGARHYNNYRYLVNLHGTYMNGLEHHQSSDNRLPEFGLVHPQYRSVYGYLLAHEMTHSWNGKYRRPAGLATANYQEPMKGELLWVYEGLTNHLGYLLAARSGIWTQAIYRDELAEIASRAEYRSGRSWRPLVDTTVAAQLLYNAPEEWGNWRRAVDFYQEGTLIWLEADTIIRKQTNGAKSLDNFCRSFYGGESSAPKVVAYTLDDIVSALNSVTPYDWRTFLNQRVYQVAPQAPLGGITGSGWKLAYREDPSQLALDREKVTQQLEMGPSLGMLIDISPENDGQVIDVVADGPAAKAGIGPVMKIVSVNGQKYSADQLRLAVKAAKQPNSNIEVTVFNGQYARTYRIDYHGGERYPHLERDASQPDMLTKIASPLPVAK
ncbi:MAG: glycyl aminopeptidase [Acidobacteriales bacterium]|nr:glycyl aminopeptidase [Terriglobales bacterium]